MLDNIGSDSQFVDLPGLRLACDMAGLGAPVVFLHGGLLDRRMWDVQFSFFAKYCCAIRYDMRGAGQSEATPCIEPFAHHEDLFRLLQSLQIGRASLVGHSNYGVALDFAIAHPEFVHKLVLVSPGLRGYEFRDPWVGTEFAAMIGALEQKDLNGAVEVFLRTWVDGPYRTPAQIDPLVRERVRGMVAHSFCLNRNTPNCKGLEPPAVSRLPEVHAPTLVVLGDKDAPDIHAIGELIHKSVVSSQLVGLHDVGHLLVMEKPNESNRIVESFLQP